MDKLFVDIGARNKEEAEAKVAIGDSAGFYQPAVTLGSRVIGKALDDRAGCAVIIEALKRLGKTDNEIYAVFATQEEVGLKGARVAAFAIEPDVGVAFDVTRTGDTPKGITMAVSLGGGAAIKVKDSSLICHPGFTKYLVDLAEEKGIKYQREVLASGGTDASAIQMTKAGIVAGGISIPCRYIHSPNEMVDLDDIEACVLLTVALCEGPLDF